MQIGVIGSGDVGQTLAAGFASRGHDVIVGSRDPAKLQDFVQAQSGRVRAGTFEETAGFGETLVLATQFSGTQNAIDLAGTKNFDGKIVIDTTNPLKFEEGKLPTLSIGFDDSAGETIQRRLPQAKVVKAFNIIGHGDMIDPQFAGGPPTMFIAGNDDGAKQTVGELIEALGWPNEVVDIGGIEESRYLEALCMLWVHYAIRFKSRDHGFKLLRR